ncbi:MAG: hypothetical protein WA901_08645, partial [Phormidesmis sp.]
VLTAGPALSKGQTVVGHEFHKSSVVEPIAQPIYQSQRYWGEIGDTQKEGYHLSNLHASYIHLHWGHRPKIAQRFVQQCSAFRANC